MSEETISQQVINDITKTFWQLLKVSVVGDVYPNINCKRDRDELILKWYMEKIEDLYDTICNTYPIKHLSVGIFFKGESASERSLFRFTTSYSPYDTFGQVIMNQRFDIPLIFKIVDNNNEISFYD